MKKIDPAVLKNLSEQLYVREVEELKDPATYCGTRNGFPFILYIERGRMGLFCDLISARLTTAVAGNGLSKDDLKAFRKGQKIISAISLSDQVLTIYFRDRDYRSIEKVEELNAAIYAVTDFIRKQGFHPCCQKCGKAVETHYNLFYGQIMQLCGSCEKKVDQEEKEEAETRLKQKEEVGLGILGALIGIVISAAVIVLLGRLGLIAFFAGLIAGILIPWLYDKFAKNMHLPGIIICVISLILAGLLGCYIDGVITILPELQEIMPGLTFFEALFAVPELGRQGALYLISWEVLINFLLYASAAAISAVITILQWYFYGKRGRKRLLFDYK